MDDARRTLQKVTPDSLTTYLVEVRRKSVPTPTEEIELGRRIQTGDEEALQELVERNLRFVVQVASKYKGYGLPLSDLINEGNLGLMHAATKFDPERGARFITYAVWWIRQAIMHALAEGGNAVRLPVKQAEALSKLRQKFDEMHQEMGTEPTVEELAQALEMTPEEVEDSVTGVSSVLIVGRSCARRWQCHTARLHAVEFATVERGSVFQCVDGAGGPQFAATPGAP